MLASGAEAFVGDFVIYSGVYRDVVAVKTYLPGEDRPADCPVMPGWVVREIVTEDGSRWFGHKPGETYKGSEILVRYPDGISFEHSTVDDGDVNIMDYFE